MRGPGGQRVLTTACSRIATEDARSPFPCDALGDSPRRAERRAGEHTRDGDGRTRRVPWPTACCWRMLAVVTQRTGLAADWRAESLAWPCAPWAHLLAAREGAVTGVVIARADMFHELQAIASGRDASQSSFAKSSLRSKPQPRKRCPVGAWTDEDVGA